MPGKFCLVPPTFRARQSAFISCRPCCIESLAGVHKRTSRIFCGIKYKGNHICHKPIEESKHGFYIIFVALVQLSLNILRS
ncbi:hypothetical protein R5R35_000035 [Gryllus longicercus]|uniref:Uncharacterized protein n=1 Tax=Gryllus longicercus TaxID=2509291 RepID=A0AAN9VKP2_9ORTH